jgi:DNA-binding NarL/FixJ family response regulator
LNSRNATMLEHEAAWTDFASEIRAFLAAPKEAIAPVDDLAIGDLTERERDVLELVAQGFNNGQIAKNLYISEKTVRTHVSGSEAIVRAREVGFGRHLPE